jgi:hypothetical protein
MWSRSDGLRHSREDLPYSGPSPDLAAIMLSSPPRSLRHEYDVYVEREIESYKDSLPRAVLLGIGDEAVSSLRAQEQLTFDEMVLWDEVDRLIKLRLRIPTYQTWRRRRLRILEKYRRPEHWGMQPTDALVCAIHATHEMRVLVAGAEAPATALYLAANGCEVTAIDQAEDVVDRVMLAAAEAGLTQRVHGCVGELGGWAPNRPVHAVVCSSTAFGGLSAPERERVIDLLQSATADGGVHLVETIAAGQAVMSLDELATRYIGWEISADGRSGTSGTFLARKGSV